MKLSEAKLNQSYTITKITAKAPLSYRLLSMGFSLGSPITLLAMTIAKGTFDVRVESTVVALRKEEAEAILIEQCA